MRGDDAVAVLALGAMVLIPLLEMALRPVFGRGIDNAPVLVQHLGLVMAMAGALVAARTGHLSSLGEGLAGLGPARWRQAVRTGALGGSALLCGVLTGASADFVRAEVAAPQPLAYGLPVWWVQAVLPVGFALLGWRLGAAATAGRGAGVGAVIGGVGWWGAGVALAASGAGLAAVPLSVGLAAVLALLLAGAPVFALLAGLGLLLFAHQGLPLASVPLSHYQITVNPSLPALPLYTLAGLVFARTGAATRLGALAVAIFGGGVRGTVVAAALLCSGFTAFTGGSGVTILALGGLLLPLLQRAGYPEQRSIGLVTSASALGVLLAPSVPLILVAVIARVPIHEMFLAGLAPAAVMVGCLLLIGGFLRPVPGATSVAARPSWRAVMGAAWDARWELVAPLLALASLGMGLATPTESAALTAGYAVLSQAVLRRELGLSNLLRVLADAAAIIGGVMLILGMALGLTNVIVDAGLPDLAVDAVQRWIPGRTLFLLALCAFLLAAAALMEIYAAIVVLVPLLLPLARSYGLEPLHFGILFLAAMEAGYLCPPAGMNLYFASSMFGRSVREVARSVLPAMAAIIVGTLLVAYVPLLSTGLPALLR